MFPPAAGTLSRAERAGNQFRLGRTKSVREHGL